MPTRFARLAFVALACAAPIFAATTVDPSPEGLAIRARAYREHLVYIVLNDGTSHAAKAPLKITSRSVTFTDADSKALYLFQLRDVNMPATLHVNNDLIPQGLWMDEQSYVMRNVQVRQLTPEEMDRMRADLNADLADAKEKYREAFVGATCGSKVGAAAELCAMNATATADRKIAVAEAKAEAEAKQ